MMRLIPMTTSPFKFQGVIAFKDHRDGRIEKTLQDQYPGAPIEYRGDVVTLSLPDGQEGYVIKTLKMHGKEVHSTDDFASIMGAKPGTITPVPDPWAKPDALNALFGEP